MPGWADCETRQRLFEESLSIARELGDRGLLGHSLRALGLTTLNQGDLSTAWRLAEESLAVDREAGDKGRIAAGLGILGLIARTQGENEKARALMDESLAFRAELGTKGFLWPVVNRICLAVEEGDYTLARSLGEECLASSRELGDRSVTAAVLAQFGTMATYKGDHTAAKAFWEESLSIYWELGRKWNIRDNLEGLADLAAARGEPERAACLRGALAALREAAVHRPRTLAELRGPAGRADVERRVAAVRATLGEEAFAAAWAKGRAMCLEEAVTFALQR